MADEGDELYARACKQWAANWLKSHGVENGTVTDVFFHFEEGHAYSSYTYESAVQEIVINYDSAGQPKSEYIDLDSTPSFGELVQQICAAYDEVRAAGGVTTSEADK